ncbi:hypothetical protein [Chelatococcus reniformis]|uniref:hypothetical protein n=1 Tax=Chelatococcus reniformis TaxID=1494448 RepID=UPI0016645C1F|nr:hypothetical protein [Chelatococcus reniformis]
MSTDTKRQRAVWLTGVVDRASCHHSDVTLVFVDQLRHKGDGPPFPEVLVPWLRDLRDRCPAGVPLDRIEGAIVLIGGLEPWEGSRLPPILDHSSDYVRACAAHMLGRAGHGESDDDHEGLYDADFIAELTTKELARPGIAGPYWSATGLMQSDFSQLGFDPTEWMLGIIERRNGLEPVSLPFNGIDFHIHELAAGDPRAVRRLIEADRADLAIMTATEIRDEVAGMTPILCEMADHADLRFAVPAQIHLAKYHGMLHPRADPERIRYLPGWRDDARVFAIRYGESDRFPDQAVIFPGRNAAFDEAQAEAIVDMALPPDRRGELARHYLESYDADPAPYRLGCDELRSYVSGAHVARIGAIEQPGWRRIEISAGRLADRWGPWSWSESTGSI